MIPVLCCGTIALVFPKKGTHLNFEYRIQTTYAADLQHVKQKKRSF